MANRNDKLRELMAEKKISTVKLSCFTGIHAEVLSDMCMGKSRYGANTFRDIDNWTRVADHFDVSLNEFR